MTQKSMFYQSHLFHASDIHLKMAELQRKARMERLAQDSEKTALARRIAARNMQEDVKFAVDYGEFAVKTNL